MINNYPQHSPLEKIKSHENPIVMTTPDACTLQPGTAEHRCEAGDR